MQKAIQSLIVDDERVAREILESHLSKIETVEIAGSCKNAVEAFNVLSQRKIDLMFLDINMPEISGLSLAKTVNKDVKIIFTTAYREYAVDGFDLQAVDYLLKPISFERLLQAINKYRDENLTVRVPASEELQSEKSDYFFVRADRKMIKICHSEITYIESLADYIKVHVNDKTVVTRETITSIEAKLPKNEFIRTHRSFIVSMGKIDSFTSEFVEIGKKQIPISRSYKNEVLKKLGT
jgi:DNA-binding LytR/AlgR family response regulator